MTEREPDWVGSDGLSHRSPVCERCLTQYEKGETHSCEDQCIWCKKYNLETERSFNGRDICIECAELAEDQ